MSALRMAVALVVALALWLFAHAPREERAIAEPAPVVTVAPSAARTARAVPQAPLIVAAAAPVPAREPAVAPATLRDYIDHGDPRSPPILPADVDEDAPTPHELADHDAYARFEQRQHDRHLAEFSIEGRRALAQWKLDRARAAASGATPAQLREADDKIAHLEAALDGPLLEPVAE